MQRAYMLPRLAVPDSHMLKMKSVLLGSLRAKVSENLAAAHTSTTTLVLLEHRHRWCRRRGDRRVDSAFAVSLPAVVALAPVERAVSASGRMLSSLFPLSAVIPSSLLPMITDPEMSRPAPNHQSAARHQLQVQVGEVL
jgi:hypothetical protein